MSVRRPPPFACSRRDCDALSGVRITGELDLTAGEELARALGMPTRAAPPLVVVDMREVAFVDASAMHVLLGAQREIERAEGRMVIVRGQVAFDWWLPAVGLDGALEVVDEREAGAA